MFKGILLLCLLLTGFADGQSQNTIPVIQGKLDLRQWNKDKQAIVPLDGEWRFCWNELIQWEEIQKRKDVPFITFSRPWNEQLVDGAQLPGVGYATYAAEVLLPDGMDSLALEVPAVYNSYALWANDKLVSVNGKVGTQEKEMTPEWRPQTVKLKNLGDTLRLIFQVANFQTARGGPASSIRLGTVEHLFGIDSANILSNRLLIAFFLVLTTAFLVAYLIATRYIMLLYFSGLALTFAIRFMFSDKYPYYDFGLSISWETAAKIEYTSVPLMVIFGVLFISSIYPIEFKRYIRVSFLVIHLILLLFTFLATPAILSQLLFLIQICSLVFLIYVIYAIVRALIYERAGAWVSTLGIAIFALAGIYNLFTYLYFMELNRIVIHTCYTLAMILNAFSLWYRTPIRIKQEEQNILRYSDLYNTDEKK